ncbi:MAG: TIGR01440 family protein [Eubacteriales bacterium]|nr:TIGR01440 family protein [Eubacteriales bacterium]
MELVHVQEKELEEIENQAYQAASEVCDAAKLGPGDLFVVGCSTSEVLGEKIGTHSSLDAAGALFAGIDRALRESGVFLAAQCCEHLGRALIVEREACEKFRLEEVNVIPQPKAGGSFGTTAYKKFKDPVAVETLQQSASAGIDIGGTLIGMHIRPVVVPLRISIKKIGEASIICARRRPKFVGGSRAVYNEELL